MDDTQVTHIGDNRPPVYYEGEKLIIRASAIGSSCLWELVAAGQGHEPSPTPEALQQAYDDGHRLEPVVIRLLRQEGYEISGQQDEGDWEILPGIIIRYHPDGIIRKMGWFAPKILEVKALADAGWQIAARGSVGDYIKEYNWQISVMMYHSSLSAMWVAYNKGNSNGDECPDQGRLLYETVDRPPIPLATIEDKVRVIKELVDDEDILSTGRPCDDPSHYPCRYLHLRPEPEDSNVVNLRPAVTDPDNPNIIVPTEVFMVPDEDKDAVDSDVREYLMFRGQMDEAKEKMEKAKERLIAKANGAKRLVTDQWVVPVVNGSNSSPDWATMPQELKEEIKKKYTKTTRYKYVKGIKRLGIDSSEM